MAQPNIDELKSIGPDRRTPGDTAPPTDAELANARGYAGGMYDRGGHLKGFTSPQTGDYQPRPAAVNVSGKPTTQAEMNADDMANAYDPGTNKKPPMPAGNAVPGTNEAQTNDQVQTKAYESSNPESPYDKDIEFTHTLARMFGMAGMADRSLAARDAHMKLQAARIDQVGADAQRAFIAGDVTKGIDMFNHMVPNGNKITAYGVGKGKDGQPVYHLEYADNHKETKTADEMAQGMALYRNPEHIMSLIQARAKGVMDLQKELLRGSMAFNKDTTVAGMRGQAQVTAAQARGNPTRVNMGLGQPTMVTNPPGYPPGVYVETQMPNKGGGAPVKAYMPIDVAAPQAGQQNAAPANNTGDTLRKIIGAGVGQ